MSYIKTTEPEVHRMPWVPGLTEDQQLAYSGGHRTLAFLYKGLYGLGATGPAVPGPTQPATDPNADKILWGPSIWLSVGATILVFALVSAFSTTEKASFQAPAPKV